ncbi:glycosyltransferase family 4 protein [Calothrix sp. PCC 6303]|uniref:glycosyltransferase family 4 protein n=1 Tax=Calothrix sp. PCC 6303 TaxID=1170562 RepID=UPI0002A00801|nr:glycosyltransferase family 4 protein [Calothrix sp. PCC 6303]AFZ00159.1 glycosyl transferase group 1 [Calothrix sp. PCC 6303]
MAHITFITPSLSSGGAERAIILLSEGFINKGYEVSLISISSDKSYFYNLPDKINVRALDIAKNSSTFIERIFNNIYRLWVVRKTVAEINPDIVISILDTTNILTLLALVNTKYPVFVSEQNNPDVATESIWKYLRRLTYPLANQVVSTSKGVDEYFYWLPKKQRAIIYNPLAINIDTSCDNTNIFSEIPGLDKNKKLIVAMGRLTEQKGFDILLDAFHKIAGIYPDWQLLILGEGELRLELESRRDYLGLNDKVVFPGRLHNPFPILKCADIFVLSSRYEGFGNVIIEAMACGLPVISTDCPSGPREIIRDGIDGILVENENISSLSTAIARLISDPQERQRLSKNASEGIERFELKKIVQSWEKLVDKTVDRKKN